MIRNLLSGPFNTILRVKRNTVNLILIKHIPLELVNGHRGFAANPLLYQVLFGEQSGSCEHQKPSSTFVLVEAIRYFGLPEILESQSLEFECLFKGETRGELNDVAPYLVKINAHDKLTENLLTGTSPSDPPWMMWPRGGAVFLRSTMKTGDLVRHFRKFTRLFDQNTKRWNYFRFFAPETMLNTIAHMDEAAFNTFSSGIEMFVVPNGNASITCLSYQSQGG